MERIVADAPKRASLRKCQGHNSYYACDLCLRRASTWEPPPELKQRRRRIVWPYDGQLYEPRTSEVMLSLAQSGDPPSLTYGVKSRSLLFDLRGFDPVLGMVPEAMHMAFLGVVKQILSLLFNYTERKLGSRPLPRRALDSLNEQLRKIQVPSNVR